jgi:hypothetical protein
MTSFLRAGLVLRGASVAQMQLAAASTVALLVSRDGIPENCFPVVALDRLDVKREAIVAGDSRCQMLVQRVSRLVSEVCGPPLDVKDGAGAMRAMLRRFREEFDASRGCLKWRENSVAFMDLLNCSAGVR